MKRFKLNVNLNPEGLIAARAKTDEIRTNYEAALNAVGEQYNSQLDQAVAAEQVAGEAVSVELVLTDDQPASPDTGSVGSLVLN